MSDDASAAITRVNTLEVELAHLKIELESQRMQTIGLRNQVQRYLWQRDEAMALLIRAAAAIDAHELEQGDRHLLGQSTVRDIGAYLARVKPP